MHKLFTFLVICCTSLAAVAQVAVSVDKKNVYTGQPIRISISIAGNAKDSVIVGDTIGAFEVLQKPVVVFADGSSKQDIIITSYDSGHYTIPAFTTAIAGASGVLSDSIFVNNMPADSLKGYGEVKSYFTNATDRNQWYQAIFLAAALLSALVLWLLLRKYFAAKKLGIKLPINGPEDWHRAMKGLQQNWMQDKLDAKTAASQQMILIRSLLQIKGISNPALTGEEMMQQSAAILPKAEHDILNNAVQQCYQMMFAKYLPQKNGFSQSLEQVSQAATALFSSSAQNNAS
jgi:hypothetical protein